ncbi:hypothetical protein AZE42_07545 [Rhizopogon vesiculosus]|uniref:Uncharacterized protein n=1 Tax=Rhizopogon vesiculosus TaxID=180088 RepID=A0A1J8QSJ0_9AGAM|nr:hypothetical protein AZE42_07545 [Rhizopogon vesiculosus]
MAQSAEVKFQPAYQQMVYTMGTRPIDLDTYR